MAVRDISEGGARFAKAGNLAVGDEVSLTFPGINAITGKIVRDASHSFGVQFAPSRLRPEELRDLVTVPAHRAA